MEMAKTYDCRINVYPTNPAEVFSKTGGLQLAQRSAERKAYRLMELDRWTKFHDLPIVREPKYFPVDDKCAAHAIISAQEKGFNALALSQELGRAQWELEQDFSKIDVVKTACKRARVDFAALGLLDDFAEQYSRNTQTAVERGVFGYPTYIYRDELFWGQDRLDFLERAVSA